MTPTTQPSRATANGAGAPFTGVIPPVCTPLDEDLDIDTEGLAKLVAHLLGCGVTGIFALGSTGEAIYLTDAQRRQVVDVVASTVAGHVPVFVGALDGTTARVLDQTRLLTRPGIDAFVVTAPFYADVTEQETKRHFTDIAAAAGLPVLAYDIPGNVGRKLWPSLTIELLNEGMIAGVKDSSGDWADFLRILQQTRSQNGVAVLTGADTRAADALSAGASGIVPGIANAVPGLAVALYRAHIAGDRKQVSATQQKLSCAADMFQIGVRHGLGLHASQMGMLKSILVEQGIIKTSAVAPPLTQYPPQARREAIAAWRAIAEAE